MFCGMRAREMSAVPTDGLHGKLHTPAARETRWSDPDGVPGPWEGRGVPGALVGVWRAPCLSSQMLGLPGGWRASGESARILNAPRAPVS